MENNSAATAISLLGVPLLLIVVWMIGGFNFSTTKTLPPAPVNPKHEARDYAKEHVNVKLYILPETLEEEGDDPQLKLRLLGKLINTGNKEFSEVTVEWEFEVLQNGKAVLRRNGAVDVRDVGADSAKRMEGTIMRFPFKPTQDTKYKSQIRIYDAKFK